jgi:alpha-mannosidase
MKLRVILILGLLVSGLTRAAGPADPAKGASRGHVEQVVVVFKTHFDIGYTDMASNVVQRYRTAMIDEALKVVDQNRNLPPEQQFIWTLPGWPMTKIAEDWPGQTPGRKQRIRQALKDGRFVVHALPFTMHTELLELEDLVRGLGFASRLSRAVGLELPRDAKMTDVPCHSWILPTLLRNAGVGFLHLGCNAASSSPQVPRLFWWEGPDRSRLLTMYTAESYGTGLVPPDDWPYKTWLALIHTGDNHGPPTPDEVQKLLEEAKQKLPGVKVRIGRLSDFADALLAEKADLPVVRGDMPDTWIHGPMCDPAGARLARNTRPAIASAEALDTELRAWDVKLPDIAPTIAAAYESSLLYGEHTWGGALYWVTRYSDGVKFNYGEAWKDEWMQGRFRRLEASWDEHTAYIEKARDLVTPILDQRVQALARAVRTEGPRIVVYNPLPWARDGLVSFQSGKAFPKALKPVDGSETALLKASPLLGVSFVARHIPPMGYRTYIPVETTKDEPPQPHIKTGPPTVENSFFKATLDPSRGVIRSLIDKRSKRELVDAEAPYGFGQYLYERFDANNVAAFVKAYVKINADWATNELGKPNMPPAEQAPYRAVAPSGFKWDLSVGPTAVEAKMVAPAGNGGLAHKVTTRVTLYHDLPCVDLEVELYDKPADPWPEAGWICLPFKIDNPQFRLGRLGSIIDPQKDIVPGANRHLLALNTGLTITDPQGRGVGLCALDNPLVSLDEPGCWKYSRDFVPKKARVYVNLFNNQWTTNFRLWNSGTWTARVRTWSVEGRDAAKNLIKPSWEARENLIAAYADGPAGKLPPKQKGLELSRDGVMVTAFGPNPDGDGWVLRLWEQAGSFQPCRVRLPQGMGITQIQPCDLRGQPLGPAGKPRARAWTVKMTPFAPVSFVLTPAGTTTPNAEAKLPLLQRGLNRE